MKLQVIKTYLLFFIFFLCPFFLMQAQNTKKERLSEQELKNKVQIEDVVRRQNLIEENIDEKLKILKGNVKEEIEESLNNTDKILELKKSDLEWWQWVVNIFFALIGIVVPIFLGYKIREVNKTQKEADTTLIEAKKLKIILDDIVKTGEVKVETMGEEIIKEITNKHLKEEAETIFKDIKFKSEKEKNSIKVELEDYVNKLRKNKDENEYTAEDWFIKGYSFTEKKEHKMALECYTKSLELDSSLGVAYLNRGQTFTELKKYNKGLEDTNKAIELLPDFAISFNNRGLIYSKLGKEKEALIDFEKAIELNPNLADAYCNKGLMLLNKGKYLEALDSYNHAINLNPNVSIYYSNRGLVYSQLPNPDFNKSLLDFNKAIELDPQNINGYNNRAVVYVNKNEYEKAIVDYSKAIEIDPDYINGYFNLCEVHIIIGEFEKANEFLLKLDEFNMDSSYEMTRLYLRIIVNRLTKKEENLTLIKSIDDMISAGIKISWGFNEIENWLEETNLVNKEDKLFLRKINDKLKKV